jgi:hypothetical protein
MGRFQVPFLVEWSIAISAIEGAVGGSSSASGWSVNNGVTSAPDGHTTPLPRSFMNCRRLMNHSLDSTTSYHLADRCAWRRWLATILIYCSQPRSTPRLADVRFTPNSGDFLLLRRRRERPCRNRTGEKRYELSPSHCLCPSLRNKTPYQMEMACPLWVKSRHHALKSRCPLYPQQRTSFSAVPMSVLCHKRTHAAK